MTTMLAPSNGTRFARFFDEDWPLPQLLGGLRHLEPQIRVEELVEGDTLVVRAEAPGIDPEKDVDISIADGKLLITVERRETEETHEDKNYRSEFRYGSFARSLRLPVGTKPEDIQAAYKDGILEIKVPIPTVDSTMKKVAVTRG